MFTDAYFTPISTLHLGTAIIDLVHKKASGIYNVAGCERLSKYECAILLAEAANYSGQTISKASLSSFELAAPRPRDMSLSSEKVSAFLGRTIPTARESISCLKLPDRTTERVAVS